MTLFMKIFFAVTALLAALVVTLVILASMLISPERVKATLLPLAEHKLHRKIDLGEINVSLLSGIEIHGLKVYEQDGLDVFLTTDLVRLGYQLLPLLSRQIVIDEVLLEKPDIRVVRLNDGQYNFSDLIGSSTKQFSNSGNNEDHSETAAVSLRVSQVMLRDGHLIFIDRVLNDKAPYRYELSALHIAAKRGGASGEVPLSIQCRINDSPLSLEGQVKLSPFGGSLDIELQNLDVVPFTPYIQDYLPGKLGGLKLNLKSTVSGTPDDVMLKGSLAFDGLDMQLDALPEAPLEKAKFGAAYDLQLNLSQNNLELRTLDLNYNGIMANITGNITGLTGQPSLDLAVTLPKLQIGQMINAVPQDMLGNLQTFDPTGSITVEATLFGSLENRLGLLKSATIDLDNVQATAGGQRPAFSGRLLLAGDQVSSKDLQIRLGDNNAAVDFKANGIYARPMTVVADISAKRFLLEPLLQGSSGPVVSTGQDKANGGTPESTDQVGPFDIPLLASGSVKIDEAVWKELTMKNFQAQYEIKDNVFKLLQMDGQVAEGSFSNTGSINLGKKGLAYSANLGVKTIRADILSSALMPQIAGSLWGTMDLDLFVNGHGSQRQTASRALSGNGNILVTNGRLVSPELVQGLGTFLHLPELKDLQFDNLTGQFNIVDGRVQLDGQLMSDTIKLFPKGDVGLDGTLNLGLDTLLSPDLSGRMDSQGSITGYLADNDGWTRLPLSLKGNCGSPVFGVDSKGLQKQASKALDAELVRKIIDFFKQAEPAVQATGQAPPDEQQPASAPANKVLQDSLQKLFGH